MRIACADKIAAASLRRAGRASRVQLSTMDACKEVEVRKAEQWDDGSLAEFFARRSIKERNGADL